MVGQRKTPWKTAVAVPTAVIVLGFVGLAAVAPRWLSDLLKEANTSVVNGLGWYYSLIVAGFVGFALLVAFGPYGNITLGPDDEPPSYSLVSWFAMLFAAGMGIGLVFWGVAEPLNHYASPPPGTPAGTSDAMKAQEAMTTSFLHWGLSAWAVYIVVGLAIAYTVHRKGRKVSLRWALEPLFGRRVRGWFGDVVDVFAIVGTLFGVAASLGFGASQFSSGLDYLGILKSNIWVLLAVIAIITALATCSVLSGLDRGIKWLSNANLVLAAVLALAVLLLGQPLFVLREFVQTIGDYLSNFVHLSFRTLPFQGEAGESWLGSWTTYYWGWWISWSPFVGIFIARISKGRTVREFVAGVLAVPTLVTFLWFSIMGGTALWQQLHGPGGLVSPDNKVDNVNALFQVLEHIPASNLLIVGFLILLVIFFVTSADSAAFVVDMVATGGEQNPPVLTRVMWAVLGGGIAAVLLWGGAVSGGEDLTAGLGALQTMTIIAAAPFSVVMVLACLATLRAFSNEHRQRLRLENRVLRREMTEHVMGKVTEHVKESVAEHLDGQEITVSEESESGDKTRKPFRIKLSRRRNRTSE
ncbi:BCCT family transporter [Arachnia propionica]|uniref:BCCT family transporter n=1 Tax=Arachnia propionica TaxID=1750 RepID=A0A3N4CW22_9ACTN|nr:BCCT family transporter [Arachnia propionica]AFN47067.1 transporter, betaine/carnitine/choline family [Arachnia propionica F0230a]QCT37365.1 BCCT family transporter [Arachnia propionica]QUC10289.1 BCCT family transporter [Arachnia propionica]QUC15025.1 BCCT family transporter [Arachnia propionica]RPA17190.1 BCCT family transporter [Arachnia propionica]